ncbi:MAG: hypothetical protein L0Z54_00005, partial [Thermoplasmata archaeon]|nr:hypothetical protein [Thermoplasmata archaeon]
KNLANQQPIVIFRVIQDLPDIVAKDVYLVDNASVAYVGLETLVYGEVTNSGPVAVSNVTVTASIQGGAAIDEPKVINGTIAPGEERTVLFLWTPLASGSIRLRIVASAPDITELDDENNIFISDTDISVEPIEGVELTVASKDILIAPSPAIPGSEASIEVFVTNAGDTFANAVVVQMNVGGKTQEKTVDSLAPQTPTRVSFSWTPDKEGTYTVRVVIDPDDNIEEFDETNNEASQDVLVEGKTDPNGDETDPTIYIIAAVAIGIGSAAAILFLMRKKA